MNNIKSKEELNREPMLIREDLLKLMSNNKLNAHEVKLNLMSYTYEIILNKKLFPNNFDLIAFTNSIYYKRLRLKEEYKEYLFKSRTLLSSRVLRDIFENSDYKSLIEIIKDLIYFIESYLEYNNEIGTDRVKNKTKTNTNAYILEWMNSIMGDKNGK